MPRAISQAQVKKIRKQCQHTFDKELDSCLEDGIFTTNQCLSMAAGEWIRCMKGHGITIMARSAGGEKPKPKP